jgi:integrase
LRGNGTTSKSPDGLRATASACYALLERDIFPFRGFGGRPISSITPPDVLAVLRPIEARTGETAHRAQQLCSQIFRYAIAAGTCKNDPTRDLRGALAPVPKGHFAATTEPKRFGAILRAIDAYEGTLVVSSALRLAPLLFVRPGELRTAVWADIDLKNAEWRYRVTKTEVDHIVPLARQTLAILRPLDDLTGQGTYVFPGARSRRRPMSDNALLVAESYGDREG